MSSYTSRVNKHKRKRNPILAKAGRNGVAAAMATATGPNTTGSITCYSSRRYIYLSVVTSNLVSTSSSPSTSSVLMPSIYCSLVGEDEVFLVDIDESQTLDHLKEAIRAKRKRVPGVFDAHDLTLYQGVLDESHSPGMRLLEIKRLSENLHTCPKLDPFGQPSTMSQSPPTGKLYIILIQIPQCESIYCEGVVLMADVANADATCNDSLIIHYRPIYLSLIVYHSPITLLSSNIDLDAVRMLRGPPTTRGSLIIQFYQF